MGSTYQVGNEVLGIPEAMEPESSPFLPKNLLKLFIHPGQFFTQEIGYRKTPFLIFVAYCFGILSVMDRIDTKLIRYDLGNMPSNSTNIFVNISSSWIVYWGLVLALGIIGAVLVYFIGGWWYTLRVKWSGANDPDSGIARLVYVYSSFIMAGPIILIRIIQTFIYSSYLEAYLTDDYFSVILLALPFWSLFVSYKGVTSLFKLNKKEAKVWFFILPSICYLFSLGLLSYLFAISEK